MFKWYLKHKNFNSLNLFVYIFLGYYELSGVCTQCGLNSITYNGTCYCPDRN
jgi:hypothetical protein